MKIRAVELESKLELESVGVDCFCLESELEQELVKFCRLVLRPGVAGYHPSTESHFGRSVRLRPENIERREEKERRSLDIKLKRHLVIEIRLIKGIGYKFRVIVIVK